MAVPRADADSNLNEREATTGRDRWKRVEAIFNAASELSGEDCPGFLAAVCGDDRELRKEVESLLASADMTLGLLKKPVEDVAREIAAGAAVSDRRIGNYQLLKLIGEGGMGEVYLAARADDQFQLQVAIKLIRLGLEQAENMIPRFRAERQILANLDHPNIARLLDGGVTPEGWPYLVMELVNGVPIDEYCQRHRLRTAERLHLFRGVCSAVEYAHHNLVVHRDIKPGNILVTEDGIPKLLDFGIASLNEAGTEKRDAGDRLMTPAYASPEQILGRPVTTATDVFTLGMLLYEILTGGSPFKSKATDAGEIALDICKSEPEPLGVRANKNPKQAPPDAAKWTAELQSIVAKAMRKDPAARYESVAQLSADVEAYLERRPVSSYAGNWRYVAFKFIGRNKVACGLAAILLAALIGLSVGMAALAQHATRERLKAEREARFLVDMIKAATPQVARGNTVTARDLVDQSASRVDHDLAAYPDVRGAMLHTLAEAYQSLGLFDQATQIADRAYRLKSSIHDPSTGDSLALFANLIRLKGEYARAEPLFRQVLAMRRKDGGEKTSAYAEALNALGECLYLEGKDAEAEPVLRNALAINRSNGPDFGAGGRNYLALLLERKGDYHEAANLLREAVSIEERTQGVNSPDYATSLHNLAGAMIDLGDLSGAETTLRRALAIRRKVLGNSNPDLAYTLNNLGYILLEKGDWVSAEPFVREALELNTLRLGPKHPLVAGNLNNWARLQQAKGQVAEARKTFQKCLDILRQANGFNSWPASQILLNLGSLEFDQRNYSAAETLARRAVEMRQQLGGNGTPGYAAALIDLAEDQLYQGYARAALPQLRQALEIRQKKLEASHPAVVAAQVRLGEALLVAGQASVAEPHLRQALQGAQTAPFRPLPWQIAEAQSALAACLETLGKTREAEENDRASRAALSLHPRPAFREPASTRMAALIRRSRL